MFRSKKALWIAAAVIICFGAIVFWRYRALNKPRSHEQETYHQGPDGGQQQTLTVAFVPVTCHLTCPVTDFATKTTTTGTRFQSQRFTEFPTVVEALKARKIEATFLLAPLAMVLREHGVPIHIVYLGHGDGSTVIVPTNSP